MKAIKCEMCGSNDVVKQDGLYVCQNCGTKYTVEEAKKLMIEGTVNIAGTVKIDDSSKLHTWMTLAKNAIDSGNYNESYNYANKIIEEDPKSVDAWIIKMKSTANLGTMGNPRTAEVISAGKNAISLEDGKQEEVGLFYINTGINLLNAASNKAAETKESIRDLYRSYFQAYGKSYAKDACSDADQATVDMLENLGNRAIELEKAAAELPVFRDSKIIQNRGYTFIDAYNQYGRNFSLHVGQYWSPLEDVIKNRTKELELLFRADFPIADQRFAEIEEDRKLHPEKYESSGCYVATAVYGSYNCPQVWTLRRFRDNTLDTTWCGRTFIKTYYAISPILVKWFGDTEWFKKMWRIPLDKMVAALQENGVESTPYQDKY